MPQKLGYPWSYASGRRKDGLSTGSPRIPSHRFNSHGLVWSLPLLSPSYYIRRIIVRYKSPPMNHPLCLVLWFSYINLQIKSRNHWSYSQVVSLTTCWNMLVPLWLPLRPCLPNLYLLLPSTNNNLIDGWSAGWAGLDGWHWGTESKTYSNNIVYKQI